MLTRKNSEAARPPCGSLTVPAELIPFSEPSFLLPGENLRDLEAIRQMMIDDIQPETNVEWLWTLDLVELSWEILRYRCLKKRILDAHRAAAIEAILQRLDGEGCRPTSCQWSGYKPNGPPQNGATIQRLPPRSNRISTDADLI
jgi:hypothetical protein